MNVTILAAPYSGITRGEVGGVDIGAEAEQYLETVAFFRGEIPATLKTGTPSWKPPVTEHAVRHRAEADELGPHNELANEPLPEEFLWCWIVCPHDPPCADAPQRRAA